MTNGQKQHFSYKSLTFNSKKITTAEKLHRNF